MATVVAILGEKTDFGGGDDVLRCSLVSSCARGVQISAPGVVLEDCQVDVLARHSNEWQTVELLEGSGPNAHVGEGFYLTKIEISGVPEGDWVFTFMQ